MRSHLHGIKSKSRSTGMQETKTSKAYLILLCPDLPFMFVVIVPAFVLLVWAFIVPEGACRIVLGRGVVLIHAVSCGIVNVRYREREVGAAGRLHSRN